MPTQTVNRTSEVPKPYGWKHFQGTAVRTIKRKGRNHTLTGSMASNTPIGNWALTPQRHLDRQTPQLQDILAGEAINQALQRTGVVKAWRSAEQTTSELESSTPVSILVQFEENHALLEKVGMLMQQIGEVVAKITIGVHIANDRRNSEPPESLRIYCR